jgi:hypothetical protein
MPEKAGDLPTRHLSIRVPWHDNAWDGTICRRPSENASCLVLPRVRETRDDAREDALAGRAWHELASEKDAPACVRERANFMSAHPYTVTVEHPYAQDNETHQHLKPTKLLLPAYSAPCIPYRWMLKESAEKLAETYELPYRTDAEQTVDDMLGWNTNWVQTPVNQRLMLTTFLGALKPPESLCFFYAKRVPFIDDPRRVVVAVGRVREVKGAIDYVRDRDGAVNPVVWECRVGHSIRPAFDDGFVLPYHDLLALSEEDGSVEPGDYAVLAPEESWLEFSYASEHVSHDSAIAVLLACDRVLERAAKVLPTRSYGAQRQWIDARLAESWKMRGPCPGLGPALSAFGVENGTMLTYALEPFLGHNEDPWPLVEQVFEDPRAVLPGLEKRVGIVLRRKWKKLDPTRKALLRLLSRFSLTREQAERFYEPAVRREAGINVTDEQLLENPYALYELDRVTLDSIAIGVVDRAVFPDDAVREAHPLPERSRVDDADDPRRVRAWVLHELERAALDDGHTLVTQDSLITGIRGLDISPPCPVGVDWFDAFDDDLKPLVRPVKLHDGAPAYQLDRLANAGALIRGTVEKRITGVRHDLQLDWRAIVDAKFRALPDDPLNREAEQKAREEKAEALRELACARLSVLVGPAGTGKTELLAMLCRLPQVERGGALLLAPTGKARVQMETRIGGQSSRIEAKTIAQFLLPLQRYDTQTGGYVMAERAPREDGFATVIVDECSMLTEEMLAAVLEALQGVERLILVGDPRQLPPIGSGRPFVDIVDRLRSAETTSRFPRVASGYAELTVFRRFEEEAPPEDREFTDLLLAEWFSGEEPSPDADEIWNRVSRAEDTGRLRVMSWQGPDDLRSKLLAVMAEELRLEGVDDVAGFERCVGGTTFGNTDRRYFWPARDGEMGAARTAERWQILSPVRGQAYGTDDLNRLIQRHFREATRDWATSQYRKIPRPVGTEEILYGDKVINIRNRRRKDVWPREGALEYVANGEIGVVVGQYKTKNFKGMPWKLNVEFSSQAGRSYGFKPSEFGDDSLTGPPLELGYAITVHKAQGSEFGLTLLIVPDPCRNLSRELLYTALTRQRRRVVILYEGEPGKLLKFADPALSETAKRLTNVFNAPKPVKVGDRFLEDHLVHLTRRGDAVRSKSEVIIADLLYSKKIDYAYEQRLEAPDGSFRYPDFTIVDADRGLTVYWEHLGLMHDPTYRERWERKRSWYAGQGVLSLDDAPANARRKLLVTRDDPQGGISSRAIEEIVDRVFRP